MCFLGPIVVANEQDAAGAKIANVVDGQQRLTTRHAPLWSIAGRLDEQQDEAVVEARAELDRLLTMANGKASLRVARANQANYEAIRHGSVFDETAPLGVTGANLRKNVAALDIPTLLMFRNFVLNKTRFVFVQTGSFFSAWELFIGLNGKGRPLNPADLIKAFVCGTHLDIHAMANIWEEKILPLENDATSALLDRCRVATGNRGSDATLFKVFEKAWKQEQISPTLLSEGVRDTSVSGVTPWRS